MLDKLKNTFTNKDLVCTKCGRQIAEGEDFTVEITMPDEKSMLVGRLDSVIAQSANHVLCTRCK